MQAYEGYFENGQFHTAERIIRIPERRRAIVNILEDEIINTEILAKKQNEALKMFSAAMKEIDDEPLDDEFFAIINSGIGIDSGVNL
jgi:hypothetical protein